jgi:hypothetical protein
MANPYVRAAIGVVLIGGILVALWAMYGPRGAASEPSPTPAPPQLHGARAAVVLREPGGGRAQRAEIACDGDRRTATGFWARDAAGACDALAATRAALLAGPGCRRLDPGRTRLYVTGAFGSRRFDHRAQHGGCPDPDGWLAVNVLAAPVLPPERELDKAQRP